jgi:hypothetical protein
MTWYNLFPVHSSLFRVSQIRLSLPESVPGHFGAGSPIGNFTGNNTLPQGDQASPDKNVNCHYTTAAFTLSPESWASSCCADLPGDQALYAVSVRRLIGLYSGFLQTFPHGNALAVG